MVSQPSSSAFAVEVAHWSDIPGWFHWREGQEEAVTTFPSGSTFVEVGCYLGRSLCSHGWLTTQWRWLKPTE